MVHEDRLSDVVETVGVLPVGLPSVSMPAWRYTLPRGDIRRVLWSDVVPGIGRTLLSPVMEIDGNDFDDILGTTTCRLAREVVKTLPNLTVLFAAVQVTASGLVVDSVTTESVPFATVSARELAADVTYSTTGSDADGRFTLPGLPAGPVELRVDAAGYRPWVDTLEATAARGLVVRLVPAPFRIERIVARVGARPGDPLSVRPDGFVVDSVLIANLPKVLETDLLRAVALAPAASSPSDYTAMPSVRGGEAYGTPILLDGARLFNPFHLGGLFSAVNPEAVRYVELVPGGARAVETGSLSGSLGLLTREGARDRVHVKGGVSLVSSRLSVEGPIGERSSFLVDGRRTYLDLLSEAAEGLGLVDDALPYGFADLHLKLTRRTGAVGKLSVSGYLNRESLDPIDEGVGLDLTADWRNRSLSLQFEDAVGESGHVELTAAASGFDADLAGTESASPASPATMTRDRVFTGAGDMDELRFEGAVSRAEEGWSGTVGLQLRDFSARHHVAATDEDVLDVVSNLDVKRSMTSVAGWARLDVPVGGAAIGGGVRAEHFEGHGWAVSPSLRLSLPIRAWMLTVDAAESRQGIRSLRNEESVYSSFVAHDVLIPVPERDPLLRNREVSASFERRFDKLSVRLTGYRRSLAGLRIAALPEDPIEGRALLDEDDLLKGEGGGHGLEAYAVWTRGPLNLQGGYRWARAFREAGGERYVPRFHREHEAELGVVWRREGGTSLSARLSVRSGQPFTPVEAVIRDGGILPPDGRPRGRGGEVVLTGAHNSDRLPAYVRLDLGWRTEWDWSAFGRDGGLAPYVAVLNALNSKNVLRAEFDSTTLRPSLEFLPQLPLLPFFGVEFSF